MKGFIFLAVLATSVYSKRVSYKNCSSQKQLGETIYMDVTPCDEDPCILKAGDNATITISFKPYETVTSAKLFAYADDYPLPIPKPNACDGHGLACPLKVNTPVNLVFSQEIREYYPSGTYTLEAGLKDQNGVIIICVVFHLKIV